MKYLVRFLILLILIPIAATAQQSSEDPFKRDPIFNRSLEDFFDQDKKVDSDSTEAEGDQNSQRTKAVRHLTVKGLDLGGGFESGPYYSNSMYNQYPNLTGVHYNRANGLFLGIKKERMQWYRRGGFFNIPQIEPHGFIGYGTASKRWDYAIGLEKLIGKQRRLMVGFEFHDAVGTEDYKRTGLIENSLTAFFGSYDFLDYYQMEGFGLYVAYRTHRWFEAAFSYNRDEFSSVEQNTSFSLFGRSSVFRPNPPVDADADVIDIDSYGITVAFNPRNVLLTRAFTFSAMIEAELADNSNTDEDFRYDKYSSSLKLFYNFEPGSVLRWRIKAGGITGNAPDIKDFYLGGIGTLRGSPFKFFQGNQMVASNLEVQFGRPSGTPGRWLKDYGMHLLLFLDSGWTRTIPELQTGTNPFSGLSEFSIAAMQHDAGVGIGSRAVRFELAWPLKEFDSSPVFWVRFNPTF